MTLTTQKSKSILVRVPELTNDANQTGLTITFRFPYFSVSKQHFTKFRIGEKSPYLPSVGRITERMDKRLERWGNTKPVFYWADKFQKELSSDPKMIRSDVARKYGIDRSKVTKHLNLFKLSEEILKFLRENSNNPIVNSFFTEKKIRPLTKMNLNDQQRIFAELREELNKLFNSSQKI